MVIPVILKGDTSAAIPLAFTGDAPADAVLDVSYQGVRRQFTDLTAALSLAFTAEETARFRVGTFPVVMRLTAADGAVKTLPSESVRIKVTDCPAEVNVTALNIADGTRDTYIRNPVTGLFHKLVAETDESGVLTVAAEQEGVSSI